MEWQDAIFDDDVESLKQCIDVSRIDEFTSTNGHCYWNPLQYAIQKEAWKAVDWLLEKGSNPFVPDENGVTALYLATREGTEEFVLNMLRYCRHCDVNQRTMYEHRTVLDESLSREFVQVSKQLVCLGAHLESSAPLWLREFANGRMACKKAAVTVVGCRKFHRSSVLETNALDVVKLIARYVWETRANTSGWKKRVE